MATVIFNSAEPAAEVRLLLNSLAAWLAEQPEQTQRAGKVLFTYEEDRLTSVTADLDEGV